MDVSETIYQYEAKYSTIRASGFAGYEESLVGCPPNQWSVLVQPENRAKEVQAPSQRATDTVSLAQTLEIAHNAGPALVSVQHNVPAYDSLLRRFDLARTAAKNPTPADVPGVPRAPEFTLMPRPPGTAPTGPIAPSQGGLALGGLFEDVPTPAAAPAPVAAPVDDTLCTDIVVTKNSLSVAAAAPLALDPTDHTNRARFPPFAGQLGLGLSPGVSLAPVDKELCGRDATSTETSVVGDASHVPYPWTARPEAMRFIVRLDRLVVPGAETPAVALAASAASCRPGKSALLDTSGLLNEPLWVTASLYSLAEKRRISDVFMNILAPPEWVVDANDRENVAAQLTRTAMFTVPQPSGDIYLVVRLYRVLQGASLCDQAADLYARLAAARHPTKKAPGPATDADLRVMCAGDTLPAKLRRDADKLRRGAEGAVRRLGGAATCPLESFALAAVPICSTHKVRTTNTTEDVWELWGGNTPGTARPQEASERLPAFAPWLVDGQEEVLAEEIRAANRGAGSHGAREGGASLGQPMPELGGTGGYSLDWRRYRINAAPLADTVVEIGPFVRFEGGDSKLDTLERVVQAALGSSDTVSPEPDSENHGGSDPEKHATKPKRVFLGDDGAVIKYVFDVHTGKNSSKSLGFSMRTNCRLLTFMHPPAVPDVQFAPQVLPRGLMRPDAAGLFAPAWAPPLSWLLGVDCPRHDVIRDEETVADVRPLPVRAPLFTLRDLEAVGQAGYVDDPHEADETRAAMPALATPPSGPVDMVGTAHMRYPSIMRERRGNQPATTIAVLDGGKPVLVAAAAAASSGDDKETHPVTRNTRDLPDYWLVPTAPGTYGPAPTADTTSPSAVAQAGGAGERVSVGTELGALVDQILVAPLECNLRSAKFPAKKTRARNICVRVEVLADDSAGAGNWRTAYDAAPTAASAAEAIAKVAEKGDDVLASLSGAPVATPTTSTGIPCIHPRTPSDVRPTATSPVADSTRYKSIGGLPLTAPLLSAGVTSVSYHNRCPTFSDSFRISLPMESYALTGDRLAAPLPPKAHLLFTVYHVAVRSDESDTDNSPAFVPIAYGMYPLRDPLCENRITAGRSIRIPLASYLPPGYLAVCGIRSRNGAACTPAMIPWLQSEVTRDRTINGNVVTLEPLLVFNLELASTVRTCYPQMARLGAVLNDVCSVDPLSLSPANPASQMRNDPLKQLAFAVPSLRTLCSASDLVTHLPTVLPAICTALAYAGGCAVLPVPMDGAALDTFSPQLKGRIALAAKSTLRQADVAGGVGAMTSALVTRLFDTLVRVAELTASLPLLVQDSKELQRRHPILDYWVSAVYDGLYRGQPILDRVSDTIADLLRDTPRDMELADIAATTAHPVANVLIDAWTSLFTETDGAGDLPRQDATADQAWLLFDIIVKDIRMAAARAAKLQFDCCRPRTKLLSEGLYASLQKLVATLARWVIKHCSLQVMTKNRFNANLVLFMRDLAEFCDRGEVIRLITIWDDEMAAAETRDAGKIWDFRLDGWRVLADSPLMPALSLAKVYRSLDRAWVEQPGAWLAHLAQAHPLAALFQRALRSALRHSADTVRSSAANLLFWYCAKIDADAALDATPAARQAVVSLLWGLASFIIDNSALLIGARRTIVPTEPVVAGVEYLPSAKNYLQPGSTDSPHLRVASSLIFILRNLHPDLLTSWLRQSPPARVGLYSALHRASCLCDMRALATVIRRWNSSDEIKKQMQASAKEQIERSYEGHGALRRGRQRNVPSVTYSTVGSVSKWSTFRDVPAAAAEGRAPEMSPGGGASDDGTRSWCSRTRGMTGTIGARPTNDTNSQLVELDRESANEAFDPTLIANVPKSEAEFIYARETLASQLAAATTQCCVSLLALLASLVPKTTHREARLTVAAGAVPGASAEVPMLFTLIAHLLSTPMPATKTTLTPMAHLCAFAMREFPAACCTASLWSSLTLALATLMDSSSEFIRARATATFYVALTVNYDFCGSRADAVLRALGAKDPDVAALRSAVGVATDPGVLALRQLAVLAGPDRGISQTRVAALVATSFLTCQSELVRSNRMQQYGVLQEKIKEKTGGATVDVRTGLTLNIADFVAPFGLSQGGNWPFGKSLGALSRLSAFDSTIRDTRFSESVSTLAQGLSGIVSDAQALAALRRKDANRDINDLADLFVRQACLYISVPCVALRWLEQLVDTLLQCDRPLQAAALPKDVKAENSRYTEAGAAAYVAAGVLAARIALPYDRALDGLGVLAGAPPDVIAAAGVTPAAYLGGAGPSPVFLDDRGRPMVKLGAVLVPRLAAVCPPLVSILNDGSALAAALMSATSFSVQSPPTVPGTPVPGTPRGPKRLSIARPVAAPLTSAEVTVADAYSECAADSLARLMRLLQLASQCWMLEGPATESALAAARELEALQCRLASARGMLFHAQSTPLMPLPLQASRVVEPIRLEDFNLRTGPVLPACPTPAALMARPGAGWWDAVDANAARTARACEVAVGGERAESNYYRATIYGERFFQLYAAVSALQGRSSAAVNLHGQSFVYRLPSNVRLEDFRQELFSQWLGRISLTINMTTDDMTDLLGGVSRTDPVVLRKLLTIATKAPKPEAIELTRTTPAVVIQITTVTPFVPRRFFSGTDAEAVRSAIAGTRGTSVAEVDDGAVDESLRSLDQADPMSGLVWLPGSAGVAQQTSKFFYDAQYSLRTGERRPDDDPYYTGLIRNVLICPLETPAILPRQRVSQLLEVRISPVRNAINELKGKVLAIEDDAELIARGATVPRALDIERWRAGTGDGPARPAATAAIDRGIYNVQGYVSFGVTPTSESDAVRNTSQLQLLLQGSVLATINMGPVKLVQCFLAPTNPDAKCAEAMQPLSDEEKQELRAVMSRFVKATRRGLDVEAFFCTVGQQAFHTELEGAWLQCCADLETMGVPFEPY